MPFQSEKQRRFMWAKHPAIARRWTKKYGSTPVNDDSNKDNDKSKRLKRAARRRIKNRGR